MSLPKAVFVACQLLLTTGLKMPCGLAQEAKLLPAGQLDSEGVWSLRIQLSEAEFAAIEPAAPQRLAFGDPTPAVREASRESNREFVANLFGTQFPWVQASLTESPGASSAPRGGQKCRLRYDGDCLNSQQLKDQSMRSHSMPACPADDY